VASDIDYYVAMLERHAGEPVALELLRGGAPTTTHLTPVEVPKPDGRRLALETLGLSIADVKDDVARRFQLRRHGGVIVVAVAPGSSAARAGLQPGDLLVSMGPYWLNDVDHVGALLDGIAEGDPVDVGFRRERRGRLTDWEGRLYAR
jgi:S1-C subfamily serine protease